MERPKRPKRPARAQTPLPAEASEASGAGANPSAGQERGCDGASEASEASGLSILPGRVAYGISKLGMTLLTMGLAEEVKQHNVAVNSLWPETIIESQASINHRLGTPEMWRKPDILVDCILRLASKEPSELTGQALLDEDFLRAEGVTDFSGYACVPGSQPPRLSWPALSKD
jgi:citronellol/citronellal dehydrogenase